MKTNGNDRMTRAYEAGREDGLKGFRRGRPNEFEACYEQGWCEGRDKRVSDSMKSWKEATELAYEGLSRSHPD